MGLYGNFTHDWSCDSEYTKKLGKYLLLQFYFHLQTFAYHLKGRKNIFVLDKMNLH